MSKDYFEQFSAFGKNSFLPFVNLNKLATKTTERFARQQLGAVSELYTSFVKHQQELMNCKKVEDAVSLQTKFASDSANKVVDYTQQTLDNLVESSSEYSKFVEEAVSKAQEQTKDKKAA